MADTPLTQLCTICHSHPPKYTCPRDSTQTCSLRCVQLHKKQALCNGRRDPAAYTKKDDLHTPAGVDRDFNFLTGVERGLDRAAQDTQGRGIRVAPLEGEGDEMYSYHGAKRKFGGVGGNREKLERAIIESGIEIMRAPIGISRQKANKTQWHSERDCINWTVEWVLDDGSKLFRSMSEDMPALEAYRRLFTHAQTRRGGGKKRKREGTEGNEADVAGKVADTLPSEEKQQAAEDEVQASAGAQEGDVPQLRNEQQQGRPTGEPTPPPSPHLTPTAAAEVGPSISTKQKKPRAKHQHQKSDVKMGEEPRKHFYLHTPMRVYSTPAASSSKATEELAQVRVVVPIEPGQTLRDVLPGRTLMEFPTIYTLIDPISGDGDLQRGFVTEAAWRRKVLGIEEVFAESEGTAAPMSGPAV